MDLFRASHQWATRPEDERFASVKEMHAACLGYQKLSETKYFPTGKLIPRAESGEVLVDIDSYPTRFSNWGFGQLCKMADVPATFMRKLPADLAVDCLKHGMKELHNDDIQLLIHNETLCRSIMTLSYKRIWNSEITSRLLDLLQYGWRVPPARPAYDGQVGTRIATEDDVLNDAAFSLSVKVGDLISPAGLYLSDHDCFAFMVDPSHPISDGGESPLYRGFFIWNSEVGSSSLGLETFLYRHCCSNHILWDVSQVQLFKARHVGQVKSLFDKNFGDKLLEYKQSAALPWEALIAKAKNKILGKDKEEVVTTIIKAGIKIGKKFLDDSFDECEINANEDGNPRSAWGMLQGVTRLSQNSAFADQRMVLDRESGKLMRLAS